MESNKIIAIGKYVFDLFTGKNVRVRDYNYFLLAGKKIIRVEIYFWPKKLMYKNHF